MLCNAKLNRAKRCHAMPSQAVPCCAELCHAMLSGAMQCNAMPCHTKLCRATLSTVPCKLNHAKPCQTKLYHPCQAVPRRAKLCHAVPSRAVPHHATSTSLTGGKRDTELILPINSSLSVTLHQDQVGAGPRPHPQHRGCC